MTSTTSIQLQRQHFQSLKKLKEYPGQSYDEIIVKLIQNFEKRKLTPEDLSLLSIQKGKMKEIWDNKEDEAWENA